ncbi:hypothetical protein C0992_001492 [Termitomyces sp. T32_za158]|nr:hypothetical protein C0992_001492 [Termitomyces sp. T32_za158]
MLPSSWMEIDDMRKVITEEFKKVTTKMLEICYRLNIKCVSVFAFAIDNFNRPEDEVEALMNLAEKKLIELSSHGSLLNKYGVRLNVVGNVALLPESVQRAVRKAERITRHNTAFVVVLQLFKLLMPL